MKSCEIAARPLRPCKSIGSALATNPLGVPWGVAVSGQAMDLHMDLPSEWTSPTCALLFPAFDVRRIIYSDALES